MTLEWSQHAGPYLLKARHYVIGQYGDTRFVGWWIPTRNYPRKVSEHQTLEDARQACEAHYLKHEGAAA